MEAGCVQITACELLDFLPSFYLISLIGHHSKSLIDNCLLDFDLQQHSMFLKKKRKERKNSTNMDNRDPNWIAIINSDPNVYTTENA